jgi:integrase
MKLYVKKVKNKSGTKESLWIRFYHNDKLVRKPLKLDNTKANVKLAETKIIPKLMIQYHDGKFFNTVPTVDVAMQKSFQVHKGARRESTQADYEGAYRLHIQSIFGDKRLDKIKPTDIIGWQNDLLEKVSPARVRAIRAVLSVMYNDALKDGIIEKSPLSLVSVPKLKKTIITPFSISEMASILNESDGQFANFYAAAFFTGMRSGELLGLKWEDIHSERNEIHVRRTIKMGVVTDQTKTGNDRTIDIIESLLPYIEKQREITGSKGSYVFLNKKGEHYYDIKNIRDSHWKRTLKARDLKYRPIYHTRHTFATVMLENNEDILWVSNMLGHLNTSMTLDKYAQYVKRKDKKRAQFLSKELSPNDTELAPSFSRVA